MVLNPGAFNGWIWARYGMGTSLKVSSRESQFGWSREKLPGHQSCAGWLGGASKVC
jgi:hypothetical protein